MPKRKMQKHDQSDHSNVNGASLANSKTTPQFRRSARLKEIEIMRLKDKEKTVIKQLRSPTASDTQQLTAQGKRKSSQSYNSAHDAKHHLDNQKPNASHQPSGSIELNTRNPVAYWALTQDWPVGFSQQGGDMGPVSSNKRKSESVHTHRAARLARMQEHRIFMGASALMKEVSKDLCAELLKRNREPVSSPFFPAARLLDVLQRVQCANEGRIQRDVLPCVVPSAENLHFCGVLGLESIVEEISALWTRCATMGSTIPKPDYVAGLSPGAFSSDELEALQNYATLTTPFLFTPNLCFPFLICEAKDGDQGLNKAHRQNLHSAAIAVRAIIELHRAAFGKSDRRVKELYGQVLVFTVAHNHEIVHIYGHYAVLVANTADTLAFHRFQIAVFSLTAFEGKDLNKPQNFIRNMYDMFAPEHRKRIKNAAKKLPPPDPRTSASFAASGPSLGYTQSQDDSPETQS